MAKNKLTIIVLVGNELDMIADCLKSCDFADELILVAANSNDSVISLARKTVPKLNLYQTNDQYNRNFSKWRNLGYQHSHGEWILYVDADERISGSLKKEILKTISSPDPKVGCYVIPRANHYLGKRVRYGGSCPDYVKRLYPRFRFEGYQGELHEEPVFHGQIGYLNEDLLHYTHRDLTSMLQKTLVWTDMEAQLLYQSHHPPVVWWRFIRMMLTKFFERYLIQQMWRDGLVGLISSLFETFDTFIIYAKLWELQQHDS